MWIIRKLCLVQGPPACPPATTQLDTFQLNGSAWVACEDLQTPGGALVLASSGGEAIRGEILRRCATWHAPVCDLVAATDDGFSR